MTMKIKPMEIGAALLIIFSGVYLNTLPIAPVYITFFLGVVFLVFGLFAHRIRLIPASLFTAVLYLLYLVLSQGESAERSAFYNYLFSLAYFIVVCIGSFSVQREKLFQYCKWFVRMSILIMGIEAIWRFTHPVFRQGNVGSIAFYRFKYSSIMYQDSNYVGIFALVVFFFILFLEKKQMTLKVEKYLCFLLIVLTISRSAIIVSIVFWFLFEDRVKKTWKTILLIIGIIGVIYFAFTYIFFDSTYQSKLSIISKAYSYFQNASVYDKLCGIGFGRTVDYIGIGSHNFFVTIILESGLVGFLILVFFWIQLIRESGKKCIYVMAPFLIAGFSMAQHFLPFLYATYAVMITVERKERSETVFFSKEVVNK